MTIKFHTNIRKLTIGRGLLAAGFSVASSISIYSGTQPTAQQIIDSWSSYNSAAASFLDHYTGVIWTQPLAGAAEFASITTFPAATLPNHAGVGSWCILWPANITAAQVALTTLPNTNFILAPVSSLVGSGIVRFSPDTNFVMGIAKAIADGLISASST